MDWYPRNPKDFDLGTLGWSLAERGAYSSLIDAYYLNEGPLPDDDAALAALLRCPVEEWRSVSVRVRSKFESSDGVLRHVRCDDELKDQAHRADIARRNGRKGGRPCTSKINGINPAGLEIKPGGLPVGTPELTQTKPQDKTGQDNSPSFQDGEGVLLEKAFEDWWEKFPRYRRGSKAHVKKKFMAVLKAKRATVFDLQSGLDRYLAAGYGQSQFACGAEVWLNQARWTIERFPPPGDVGRAPARLGMAGVASDEALARTKAEQEARTNALMQQMGEGHD